MCYPLSHVLQSVKAHNSQQIWHTSRWFSSASVYFFSLFFFTFSHCLSPCVCVSFASRLWRFLTSTFNNPTRKEQSFQVCLLAFRFTCVCSVCQTALGYARQILENVFPLWFCTHKKLPFKMILKFRFIARVYFLLRPLDNISGSRHIDPRISGELTTIHIDA